MKKVVARQEPGEDTLKEKDKKRVKKALIAAAVVFAAVAVIALGAKLIASLLKQSNESVAVSRREAEESGIFFFEPDYSENIMEDELDLALDRTLRYSAMGEEILLTPQSARMRGGAAQLFYDYFQCIIGGDYAAYPGFFTQEYKNNPLADIPQKFTMQKVYDIGIKLFDRRMNDSGDVSDIYEVRYAIFENNGTFRRDIPSMETRTLVFEIVYVEGEPLINSIGYRKNA